MSYFLMSIDQGTTSSRAIIFSEKGKVISLHQIDLPQSYPHPGWVEQNPKKIWKNTLTCCYEALKKGSLSAKDIAAIGITNQRETTIIWDRATGEPIYPAIVWQDRRTSELCERLHVKDLQQKTGLLLDPYFSATKILWILEHVPDARKKAERGELAFGTVDTFLLWYLTAGKVHATDATNASRTLLFNIQTQAWDQDILSTLNIPISLLPDVYDSSYLFGETTIFGKKIPITGIAGDQQAATIGQACFHPGMIKCTFGTGCFMLLNTGDHQVQSQNRLLTTVAYRLNNRVTYGLEGSIFSAGVTIKWLRDTLRIIHSSAETEIIANGIESTEGVYFIPAFTGLGAPYWDPNARGAIVGLTRNSGTKHIVRAALESVAYQTRDLLDAMRKDSASHISSLRVDGGMAANNWLLQFLADILPMLVQRPACVEASAQGAAYLAGLHIGMYQSLEEIAHLWRAQTEFKPNMQSDMRETLYQGWQKAVTRVLS